VANSKISALANATTPLAGTETLPIVQSGATVKATVANITGGGGYPGSFTSLAYTTTLTGGTGIVNLGSGQFYKNALGNIGLGTTGVTQFNLRIVKTITGSVNSYGTSNESVTQSDVTNSSNIYSTTVSTQAAAFTLGFLRHYITDQSTIGAGSVVTNQWGFQATSTLIGATSNIGYYGNINAPTSGISTTGTISSISSSGTTVTVNHNAITYTNGQTVTITATANATSLTSGAICTILTVGTTDFTLIGAASNTVGVSFTATGAGTGTGTVTLNVQNSGKTVAGAALGSFTYTTATSQTFAAITVLTGSVTVSTRYNLYMAGTASNYLAGGLNVGATTDPGVGNINASVGFTANGVAVPTISSTSTLTNKRVTPRVSTTTSSATPTINTDNVDVYGLTAQAVDITSFTTNLSGTPTDGQLLRIYIVGTAARAITWGASFEASTTPLPTTTVTTNRLDVGFVWNAATSKWRCLASA
jgi:hypothetical protein